MFGWQINEVNKESPEMHALESSKYLLDIETNIDIKLALERKEDIVNALGKSHVSSYELKGLRK